MDRTLADFYPDTFREGGIPKGFNGTIDPSVGLDQGDEDTPHYPSEAVLPGQGERSKDCGEGVAYHCNSCGQPFWTKSSCMQRTCPDCYEKWASKEARVASKRVSWAAKCLRTRNLTLGIVKHPRLVHIVVSVRDRGTVEELRREAYAIAKSKGISGGAVVFHPFRQDKYDGRYTLQDCVHFHIIGFAAGDIKPGGTDIDLESAFEYAGGRMMDLPLLFMEHRGMTDWDEITEEQKTDWVERIMRKSINRTRPVFKHIDDDEYKDYRGFRSGRAVKRCIQYLLSHCGIIEGMHTLTWYGSMSYRTMTATQITDMYPSCLDPDPEVKTECPVCGSRDTEPCIEYDPVYSREAIRSPNPKPFDFYERRTHKEPSWPEGTQGAHEQAWHIIETWLNERGGRLTRNEFDEATAEGTIVREVLDMNLKSGRLVEQRNRRGDDDWIMYASPEFGLDSALVIMHYIEGEAKGDERLRRLIEANPGDENDILSDIGFVFGSTLERFARRVTGE